MTLFAVHAMLPICVDKGVLSPPHQAHFTSYKKEEKMTMKKIWVAILAACFALPFLAEVYLGNNLQEQRFGFAVSGSGGTMGNDRGYTSAFIPGIGAFLRANAKLGAEYVIAEDADYNTLKVFAQLAF